MPVFPICPGTPPPAPVQGTGTLQKSSVSSHAADSTAFRRELDSLIKPESAGLVFSRHAQKRLDMRGINFTREGLRRIEAAVDKAREKGSRDAVILADTLALVVNVPSRTVVTVMDRENMQESVVTNIDSAVFA